MSHRDQVVNVKSEIAMSDRRRKELVAANADLILASELSAHAYVVHFEAQMRGGKMRRLLHASSIYIARACACLADLDPQAIR
jgi:hypothetical protein